MLWDLEELWKVLWSYLGPIFAILFFLFIFYPEKFEKMAILTLRVFSLFSERAERRFISREVSYIVSTEFVRNYHLEEVPKVIVKWGEEDEAILDLRRNLLLIVLRRGRKHRYDNVARAVLKAIPELLAPEMKVVYDPKFIDCLSAHIARSLLKDYRTVVTAINDFVASKIEIDEELRKVLSMLVEIDDQSLLSRILLPELVDVAKLRYPHRDPQIDYEVLNLVETLYKLVKGEVSMPVICGKYFRTVFVRVARPEKIEAMLEPHIRFVKYSLSSCPAIESIYVLAAGKLNIVAAKALEELLVRELKSMGYRLKEEGTKRQEYEAGYKGKPRMRLYVCRMKIEKVSKP
jgi:hypothetical protein